MTRDEKFLEKNKKTIEEFHLYLETHNVKVIVVSPEIWSFFETLDDFDNEHVYENGGHRASKFKGIRLITDVYSPATSIRFINKENEVKLILPCLCGVYPGEDHDWLLKDEKKITLPKVDPKKVRKMNEGVDSKD